MDGENAEQTTDGHNSRYSDRYQFSQEPLTMNITSRITRRHCLKIAGITMVGAWTVPAEAKHLWTKARKNFRLGIFANVYRKLPLEEATAKIKADGLRSVITDFNFADVRFNPAAPDWDAVKKVRASLDRQELAVAGLYGYYNMVAPDAEVRRKGRERMEFLLANWKQFGSPHVTTETGTFTTKADKGDSPKNASEEGYQDLKREVAELVKLAGKSGAVINIEVSWRQVIGTIERVERLLREISSPGLKVTLDPANFFRPQDLPNTKPMLEEMFRRLGPQIVIAHAKDVRVTGDKLEYPPAGQGMIDYLTYLSLLAQLDRPTDLVLEYLKPEDVSRTVAFLRGVIDKLP
ncbi:MAG: sugar phosphate isomerase/epimerase [Verrucomicrobia bacterium]|nr:sugar phosphate isomerase/epimerase [Verrucomicrobiota bacterium]